MSLEMLFQTLLKGFHFLCIKHYKPTLQSFGSNLTLTHKYFKQDFDHTLLNGN